MDNDDFNDSVEMDSFSSEDSEAFYKKAKKKVHKIMSLVTDGDEENNNDEENTTQDDEQEEAKKENSEITKEILESKVESEARGVPISVV